MKRFVPRLSITNIHAIRAVAVAILSLAAVTNSARGQLFGIEYDTGNLYRISTANAALSLVGNTGASLLGSLEYRPSNGFLYGIVGSPILSTGGSLYRINPANASTTLVGSIGPEHVFEGGLVIAPDGTAYATNMNFNTNPTLFKINLDTAATTTVGTISGGDHDINGLAWRSDNMLVGLDRVTDALLVINPSTAASSVIAAVSAPIGGVGGMAAIGDSGYLATGNFNGSNSLYSFNLNSGAHTLIGSFAPTVAGVGIGGLALVVPEPASVTLAALAIVPLFVRRRRPQVKTPNFFGCRDRNATSAVSAVALCRCNRSRAFSKLTFVASLILFCAISLVALQSASAVMIDMVPVGNPGDAPDTRYNSISVGSVANAFQIGKYEVTAGQYSEFLNAVAKADPNGLYNTAMGDPGGSLGANIQRTGSSPNFSYSVAADWANRPVNYVSFWDSARFANWLDNGQPTGAQGPGTTEGGAYHDVGNQTLFGRNAGAKFFIPTEDEWYKAAYHDNSAGLAASYFDYPTGSNTAPINTLPDPGNHANFYDFSGTGNNSYTIGGPYHRTEAGAFGNSASPYGTFDQAGNVWEWNETAVTSSSRGQRGGSWDYDSSNTRRASFRYYSAPTLENRDVGFRVASIPEPSAGVLGVITCGLMWCWRKRISRERGAVGFSSESRISPSGQHRSPAFSNLTFVASLILFCAIGLLAPQPASAVMSPTVPIGNPGNGNDPLTGNLYGGVAYAYRSRLAFLGVRQTKYRPSRITFSDA